MYKSILIAICVGIVLTMGVLGYVYRQGIKISTRVCQENKLRQELTDANQTIKNKEEWNIFSQTLVDEATLQLALEAKQSAKLQEKIDALERDKTPADNSYQCVPDGVLQELRELRLLRRNIR